MLSRRVGKMVIVREFITGITYGLYVHAITAGGNNWVSLKAYKDIRQVTRLAVYSFLDRANKIFLVPKITEALIACWGFSVAENLVI